MIQLKLYRFFDNKMVKYSQIRSLKKKGDDRVAKIYQFQAELKKVPDINAAYVDIPFDVKATFGKGRVPVIAIFDGVSYEGSLVKMGTPGHIIGVRQSIRVKINKQPGDVITVTLKEREEPMKQSFETIDAYIVAQAEDIQPILQKNPHDHQRKCTRCHRKNSLPNANILARRKLDSFCCRQTTYWYLSRR